ncbi:MAG TPA: DUF1963 domain-containing protein [Pirellulales bacterium]|jgi:uncharacterized protein YwqG|nr:DUF1963 domain-containing protein [Pirellulales bacterium]
MESSVIVEQLEPWRAKHRRAAWKPIVEEGDRAITASKFSGVPWIGPTAPWPECMLCKQPLPLFVQLNLDELPDELEGRFGTGLLQLFYCLTDECQGFGGWAPFEDSLSRVRVVRADGHATPVEARRAATHFPPKQIVGWERFLDLPASPDHEELGLLYDYDLGARTAQIECPELGLTFKNIRDERLPEKIADSDSGDKLAGWPAWSQGPEYPHCPKCGRRMILVFQIDSEDNLPFMFGDTGTGHITQCPDHRDVVAFGWACS